MSQSTCTRPDCERPHFGKGMCLSHYNRYMYRLRKDPERYAAFKAEQEALKAARKARIEAPEKACSKCGETQPKSEFSRAPKSTDGLHSWCKSCLRALAKKNYDPQRAREQHAKKQQDENYRAMKKRAYDRWRAEHPDRMKAAYRRWREENPERVAAAHKAWREANIDVVRWYKRNDKARRRARIRKTQIEAVSYRVILKRDGMVCHICRGEITTFSDLHMDHVVPLARGGAHSMDNIKPAHASCNLSKGAKLLEELT